MVISYLRSLLGFNSFTHHDHEHHVTILIDDSTEVGRKNLLYVSTWEYLFSKYNPKFHFGEYKFSDLYQGVELKWRILRNENKFEEKHRDLVMNSYIPFVESKAKEVKNKKRTLETHTYSQCSGNIYWETKRLDNDSTFETIFMKDELKRGLIHDLDRFIGRKDFYKRVGTPWTRSYLLHGLPGAGKASLVAAMANYLNFDVYKLPLTQVMKDDFHRNRIPLEVMDCSILLVEDIDCSLEGSTKALSLMLSSLRGFYAIEGSIVILTTNNKERTDPTVLCRIDEHIYMGHCCFEGFKMLASNYLDLSDETHRLYPDIKRLIDGQVVTPGQVVEELRKSQDVDVALEGLVRSLEMKEFDIINTCPHIFFFFNKL